MKARLAVVVFALLLHTTSIFAQTPGQIIYPATSVSTFLDPDLDEYITSSGSAFTGTADEIGEFEGNWTSRYQRVTEPSGDAATGSACASVDIVDPAGEKFALYTSVYDPDGYPTNSDGDEYFLVRLRIGKDPGNANFGYSVLLDTDLKFGSGTDPNYVSGNGGFEVEIRLQNGGGGKGVHLDDVDGATSGTTKASYSYSTHHQKAYAQYTSTGCTNDPIFVDIAVPFSDLQTYFSLSPTSNIRIVAATTSSGATALGSGVSDVSGTDDDDPSYINQDDILSDVTTNQPSNQSLPVELSYFSVLYSDNQPGLIWETSSEVNTERFDVEVSDDGVHFATVGSLSALGTSITGKTYRFLNMPIHSAMGTYYARLKIIDFDGYTEYSGVLQVNLETDHNDIQAFPNPVNYGRLTLSMPEHSQSGEVQIIDQIGNIALELTVNGRETVDVSSLKPGIYFVRDVNSHSKKTTPIFLR